MQALVARRQRWLGEVLSKHGAPPTWRDVRNVLCGIKGVRFEKVAGSDKRVWSAAKRSFESLADALQDSQRGATWRRHAVWASHAGQGRPAATACGWQGRLRRRSHPSSEDRLDDDPERARHAQWPDHPDPRPTL